MRKILFFSIICSLCLVTACQGEQENERSNIKPAQDSSEEVTSKEEASLNHPAITPTAGLAPIQSSSISPICSTEDKPASETFGYSEPPIQFTSKNFTADWFVAPSALNMPHEVLLTPAGEILVQANGSNQLFRISEDGETTLYADQVSGYYGDVNEAGNIYLYDFVTGSIIQIEPNGKTHNIVESRDISTACDSGFTLAQNGKFFLALNHCGDKSDLFEITMHGDITLVKKNIPNLPALRSRDAGSLVGITPDGSIIEVSLDGYELSMITRISFPPGGMEYVSAGGLAFDQSGAMYISTCGRCNSGRIWKVDADGRSALWAEVPNNGLSGIEWLQKTGEIIGSQLRVGSLIAVSPETGAREIIPGSGIVTPTAIEFSPCGELVVGNDEGGNLSIIDSNGNASWLADFISIGPPNANITFDKDGTLYVSEAAPGFPDQILKMPVGQAIQKYAAAVKPAGLIMLSQGDLLVAEPTKGQISTINVDTRQKKDLYDGLDFPTAIEKDSKGNLYVITASQELLWDEFWAVPVLGDQILRISPDSEITSLYKGSGLRSLAMGTDNFLYAANSDRIIRISEDGVAEDFASGMRDCVDLTFDLAGNLYVCDRALNGIVRITGFPQGRLTGKVLDEGGQPVEAARVDILSEEPSLRGKVVYTNQLGQINAEIAAGRAWTLEVSKPGLRTVINEFIPMEEDQTIELMLELKPN